MKRFLRIIALVALFVPATMSAKSGETTINVIPYPESVTLGKGSFKAAGAIFNCDNAIDKESQQRIKELADKLTFISGRLSSFATPPGISAFVLSPKTKGFLFVKDSTMDPEEYSIDINKKRCIVKANGYNGFLYAIQTLKQLMPVAVFGNTIDAKQKFMMPCVTIMDQPRFAYRGMHIDCSRHFFPVEEVKKYLDIMAVYKLNRLHWHLTDDQGWRVEIKKYPRLTEVGAFRNGTVVGKDWSSNDGIRYGGYYTQEQLKDVVAYAAKLGITIIPEIDLPGHMMGALAAYPELGCTGGPYEVWTRWGISPQVLCPGKEAMFTFLEGVFDELVEIFPSEYIHIGGDECPKTEWEQCPACQAKIKELGLKDNGNHTAEQYLQNYVTARVQEYLNGKGRKIIGWDEILEGELAKGATVMSWRGVDGGIKASSMGYDVIMTPNSYLYFDYYQSQNMDKEPFGIGGDLPLEKVYSYEPHDGIDDESFKHILGVQANLWTEYVATPEHLEYMLLPRMTALSEVQWCTPQNKSFDRFKASLEKESVKIFETLGYNYRKLD